MILLKGHGDRLQKGVCVEVNKTMTTYVRLVQVLAKFTWMLVLSTNGTCIAEDLQHVLGCPKGGW